MINTVINVNEPIEGISWTVPPRHIYPYVSRDADLLSYKDPYQRNAASLLASVASFCKKVDVSKVRDITPSELIQIGRICNNQMTLEDYEKFVDSLRESLSILDDQSTILHLNLLKLDETSTNMSIPHLKEYERFILSSYTATGKVIIFLISPTKPTINAYCTTVIPFEEAKDTLKQLLKLLSTAFGKAFTVQLRLQVPESFHPDPLFTALFLIAIIYQRGKYMKATESSILKFKLSMIREFIIEHDEYLGKLDLATVNSFSYPFQLPHRPQDSYTLLEKKGWQVMDVSGDGNCGYYSLFLGLKNVGINDYQTDTQGVSQRVGLRRWQKQVVAFRQHLREGSVLLAGEVFPEGSPNRSLAWWNDELGVFPDDDIKEFSDSFLIPNTGRDEQAYFHRSFTENDEMHQYHMHPYWTPLVFSFLYNVRVVVITRTTKPKENATKPSHFEYTHTTKIFDFDTDEFEMNKATYVPVTSSEKCVRISDTAFSSKPTIEILYITGFKFSHIDEKTRKAIQKKDDQHFLFLRRVLCVRIPPNLPLPNVSLRTAISEDESPQSEADTMDNPSVAPIAPAEIPPQLDDSVADKTEGLAETPVAPVVADPTSVAPIVPAELPPQPDDPIADETNVLQETPVVPMVVVPTFVEPIVPTEIPPQQEDPITDQTNALEETPVAPVAPEKRASKKRTKKIVSRKKAHKKKQHPKATRGKSMSVLLANEDNDNENQSLMSNVEFFDNLLYDTDTQSFYTARFDNSLKRYVDKTLIEDINSIDQELLNNARSEPNSWVSLPLGSSCDELPPAHLTTTVKCLYEQLDKPYCVTYCMASALFYCGFVEEAIELAGQASVLAPLHRMAQINSLREFMPNLVPSIGCPTIFGKQCMGNNKKKRNITWSDLFQTLTPYPTLVVPVTADGKMRHAFCIVDDLIFDSSVPHALKLVMESVDWIYHHQPVEIFVALRFNQKVSPQGQKVRWRYTKKIKRNWMIANETFSTGRHNAESTFNKAYDVEYAAPWNLPKASFNVYH